MTLAHQNFSKLVDVIRGTLPARAEKDRPREQSETFTSQGFMVYRTTHPLFSERRKKTNLYLKFLENFAKIKKPLLLQGAERKDKWSWKLRRLSYLRRTETSQFCESVQIFLWLYSLFTSVSYRVRGGLGDSRRGGTPRFLSRARARRKQERSDAQ